MSEEAIEVLNGVDMAHIPRRTVLLQSNTLVRLLACSDHLPYSKVLLTALTSPLMIRTPDRQLQNYLLESSSPARSSNSAGRRSPESGVLSDLATMASTAGIGATAPGLNFDFGRQDQPPALYGQLDSRPDSSRRSPQPRTCRIVLKGPDWDGFTLSKVAARWILRCCSWLMAS